MGQDGIPMSIAVLFVGVLLGTIAFIGLLIAVVLLA
ncbi:hypothetical protein ES703_37594 [subsurface metagenome]